MKLVIAEKPSVANSIADVLGADKNQTDTEVETDILCHGVSDT